MENKNDRNKIKYKYAGKIVDGFFFFLFESVKEHLMMKYSSI